MHNLRPGLSGDDPLATVRLPKRSLSSSNNTVLRMLRYKTEIRPDLVALYDIRPGNGAGQFLQPRSPHGV